MLAKDLAYYRAHFREAVQKDGVICLECGAIFKYLPGHLCKHGLSSEEYRAKWGYHRLGARGVATRTVRRWQWLPCFLRDTLLVRAALLTAG